MFDEDEDDAGLAPARAAGGGQFAFGSSSAPGAFGGFAGAEEEDPDI